MKENQKINARELIVDMLKEITARDNFSHVTIRNVLTKYNYIDVQEKAFIKRVTEGTLERMIQIDYCVNQFSKVPVNKMKPLIRNLIRMSVYQLLFMEHIPDSAVCNEAVKLAEKRKFQSLKGFVNGVLRTIAREKEKIQYPDKATQLEEYLSVVYSMPKWIVEMWLLEYPAEQVEQILKSLLENHFVTVRIREDLNTTEKEEMIAALEKSGVKVQSHEYLPYAYRLEHAEGIGNLELFQKGALAVQDISSMMVGELAAVEKEMFVIDTCAAPGGKTLHIASKLKGSGKVLARDLTEKKVELIRENVERFGYTNVEIQVYDAAKLDETLVEAADVVLVDVPCSGLGVIGKKKDIKYNVSKESLESLLPLQREILKTAQHYVKKGGTFIYSTCTIHKAENEEMLQWFVHEFPFEMESIDDYLPKEICGDTTKEGYLQMLPGIHDSDGFFIARLKRME